jgi:hypothetical protein
MSIGMDAVTPLRRIAESAAKSPVSQGTKLINLNDKKIAAIAEGRIFFETFFCASKRKLKIIRKTI